MAVVDSFSSSHLGTKEHWDITYERDMSNFKNTGDIGEIWYGEESMERIVDWVLESEVLNERSTILDIGCGNGAFLLRLASEGYKNLLGIDYSEKAITLAKNIAASRKLDIVYETADLLSDCKKGELGGKRFDVIHDKGTYDTISLMLDDAETKRKLYIKEVYKLMKDNSTLIVTTCNWTEEEILSHFTEYFELVELIPTPKFLFGGKVGSLVSSMVLKKVLK